MKISEVLFSILIVILSSGVFVYAVFQSRKADSVVGKSISYSSDIIDTDRKIKGVIENFEHCYLFSKEKNALKIAKEIEDSNPRSGIEIKSVVYDESLNVIKVKWKKGDKNFETKKRF